MPALVRPSAVLLALLVVHVADHTLRQDRAVPGELSFLGSTGLIAAALVLALALRRRPEASALAVIVGAGTAVGFAAVHLLPHWGAFSDPYPAAHLDALSWASMLASLLAGAWLALAGVREARLSGVRPRRPRQPA
jgi:hypothetical protein